MRHVLTCLLLIGCGQGASSAGGGGAGGQGTGSVAGSGGRTMSSDGGSTTYAGGGRGAAVGGSSGGRSAGGGQGGGQPAAGSGAPASLKLVPNVVAGAQTTISKANLGSSAFAQRVGTASGTSLQSLKYYVQSIQLCEDVQLMGSGFSNTRGCVELYSGQQPGAPSYDQYMVTEALADTTPGRYVDLMTAAGQAALRQPRMVQLPPRQPGTPPTDADAGVPDAPDQVAVFRYGLINFYRPIKVTATFPIAGEPGNYFRTRAVIGTHRMDPMPGFLGTETVDIGDSLSGATEETTYMLNNGGALFTFQKPFVITQADVAAQTEMKIDLVFNPENFGQAYEADCPNQWTAICDPANKVAIDMPFVHMSPVPRKHGERTRKETYLLDYETGSKIRIELYYNDADPEASVQGVDTAIVYGETAPGMYSVNTVASNFVAQSGSVRTSDASVSLQDYRHTDSLTGLRRRQSGTATLHCLYTGGACTTLGTELSRSYTYVGDSIVSED